MTEVTSAVNVKTTYRGREHPVFVPFGTTVEKVWREVRDVLGVPEDVEVYDGVTPVMSDGFGLSWNHPLTRPVTLQFKDYEYPATGN
jgi:hypothetical protein